MKDGKLTKIVIRPFVNKRLTKAGEPKKFTIPINPENVSRFLEIKNEKNKGQGNQGTDSKYSSTAPEQLKLDFVLDGTNTFYGYDKEMVKKSVTEQFDMFLDVVYKMNGKIHRPHRLKVSWGEHYVFDCTLENVDAKYTLFHSDGTPLRLKVSATFKEYKEQKKRVKEEDKSSPDLTHILPLKGGEKLPGIVYDIYGDQSYYLQVARVNELTSFRNIEEGLELIYPPLKK